MKLKFLHSGILLTVVLIFSNSNFSDDKKSQLYLRLRFLREDRVVEYAHSLSKTARIPIEKPKFHVNCDGTKKIRFAGKVAYRDGEVAKAFPILDAATMQVWYTDQKGTFDFEMPGDCALYLGALGKQIGIGFAYLKKGQRSYEHDIQIENDAYLIEISEAIPRKIIEGAILGTNKPDYTTYPREDRACLTGLIPQDLAEFRVYGLDDSKSHYFAGIDYDDFFEISAPAKAQLRLIAYASIPKHKIRVYAGSYVPNDKSQIHQRAGDKCRPYRFTVLGEYTYEQLETNKSLKIAPAPN